VNQPSEVLAADTPSGRLASSFRDPSGRVVLYRDRVLRIVNPAGLSDLTAFLSSSAGAKLVQDGLVIGTSQLSDEETRVVFSDPSFAGLTSHGEAATVFEHDRVAFPSYPYEWPAEMLFSAGQLTLDLAQRLLAGGFGLKDGTPYNVLFRGSRPVFVDVLSFERRDPGDSLWLPYAQFVRTFLLPLLAAKHFGLPPAHTLLTRRDGLEPEEVYRWLSPGQKLSPAFLSLVSMPCWLASKYEQKSETIHKTDRSMDPEKARFILEHLLKGTARKLSKVSPREGGKSVWTEYMGSNNNYSTGHFAAKETFVRDAVDEFRPKRVLDVGCNTGHFSEIAAGAGAEVVALDYDPIVLGEVWRRAEAARLNILPLNVNLCRPTPGTGWRNEECPAFLDRARGAFDCVLMLAVIHHMLVTERVPLPEIIDMAAEITRDLVIVEFVGPEDSMFRRIARGRDHLHADLNIEVFEQACGRRFEIVRQQHLPETHRWLYLLRRRPD
jgi:ribosomal protein L11 methylase PrmA